MDTPVLKVLALEKSFLEQSLIGSSTGFINQSFDLQVRNIIDDGFKIMIGQSLGPGDVGWSQWHQVRALAKATRDEASYELNPTVGKVRFGDNRRGSVPPKGSDNLIITDCAVTEASNGNILSAKIDGFFDMENGFSNINIFQLLPATGGQDREEISQAELRIFKDLKNHSRAINVNDFSKMTYNVPGLMIKRVKVLPLYKPGIEGYPGNKADNCMTLVVEPYSTVGQGKLTPEYKKNIIDYLEKYRLITTKVYVIEPSYVGLEIYGEIVIKANFGNAEKIIEDAIHKHINNIQKQQSWEVRLSHGDIYGAVDLLECVSQIRYLTIEPLGHRVFKTNKGDIVISADSRFYLKKADLTLINSEHP